VQEAKMEPNLAIWDAPDRDAVIAVAIEQLGETGDKMLGPDFDGLLVQSPPDIAAVMDLAFAANDPNNQSFAQGVVGYADDRIADSPMNGWLT
jgi:hypothetical protein